MSATNIDSPLILVVDDSPIDRRVASRILEKQGWRTAAAGDGREALASIASSAPDVVITDLQMPNVNGLELVERVREQYSSVPIVLMTGHGSEEIAVAALKAGAAGYVPKRTLADELIPVVEQVLTASRTGERLNRVMSCATVRSSGFVMDNDPALVPSLVSVLQQEVLGMGLCDATGVIRIGVALEEAMLNAVYHGNLGVSSKLKAEDDHAFYRLAEVRRGQAPFCHRRVRVSARLSPEKAVFVIADDGDGFDVNGLPDPTDLSCLERPSGRGLLLMRTFMDDVRYNSSGNRVTMLKRREARREVLTR